jgi:hypothetical protein
VEKDKIMFSLVDKVKKDEAKINSQSGAHKAKVEDLRKKLAEANENFELEKVKQEISEWSNTRLEKNVEELRESKERCFEKSLDCVIVGDLFSNAIVGGLRLPKVLKNMI